MYNAHKAHISYAHTKKIQAASWFSHFSLSPSSPPLILEAGEFSKRGAARYQLCIFFNIAQKAFRVYLGKLIFTENSLTYSMFTADFFSFKVWAKSWSRARTTVQLGRISDGKVCVYLMYVVSNVSDEAFFCAWIVPTATVNTTASHIFPQVRITREKMPSSCSLWGDISC